MAENDTSQYLLPKYRHLKKEYDAVTQCNRCGFCETVCPTYMISGKETLSPRGRNQAFRQILEGKIVDPAIASEVFSTCLTCHACTNVCFSQVPVGKLMAEAREVATEASPARPLVFAAMRVALSHRWILSTALWTALFFKRIGVSKLLRVTGILGLISKELEAGDELFAQTPWKFGADTSAAQHSNPSGPATAYFSGCGIHYLYPDVATACVKSLSKTTKLQCPSHSCCGLIAHSQGDVEGAKRLAQKNIDQFSKMNVDQIVVDDGSCCGLMKNYGDLLGTPEAAAFSKKVKSFSEAVAQSPGAQGKSVRATYHDPCQLGNGQQIYDAPRKAIKNKRGVEFVEMEESNWCCGGAGTYCLKHPGLAEDVLARKMDNIQKSGAEVVVTEASSCLLHVDYGIRKKGLKGKFRVMHLAEFLEKGY